MVIDVLLKPKEIRETELKSRVAVVLDVLRATSSIVTALANGCRAVIPAKTISEARKIERCLKNGTYHRKNDFFHDENIPDIFGKDILLGGERGGERVPGFSHGNSPLEYGKEAVADKVLVLTTTNGTKAIRLAAKEAPALFIGSLLNARAAARKIWLLQKDTAVICAGTDGNFSLEDSLAAGVLIKEILQLAQGKLPQGKRDEHPRYTLPEIKDGPGRVHLSDLAAAVYRLALWYGDNLLQAFYDSRHGQKLLQLGFEADLHHCARINLYDLAPVYRQGIIYLP